MPFLLVLLFIVVPIAELAVIIQVGGLIGFWPLNEGTGNVAQDLSQFASHGRIHGNPVWVRSVTKPLLEPSVIEDM